MSVWRSSYVEGAERVAGPTLSIKAFFGSERVFFGSERQFLDSSEKSFLISVFNFLVLRLRVSPAECKVFPRSGHKKVGRRK